MPPASFFLFFLCLPPPCPLHLLVNNVLLTLAYCLVCTLSEGEALQSNNPVLNVLYNVCGSVLNLSVDFTRKLTLTPTKVPLNVPPVPALGN